MNIFRLALVASYLFVLTYPALAQTPIDTTFTYQGQLNALGIPATGPYDFELLLFDAAGVGAPPVGGTRVGATQTLLNQSVLAGVFMLDLDFGDVFMGDKRWLEIHVRPNSGGAYTVLSPRQELSANPYALWAKTAGSTDWANLLNIPADFADNIDNVNGGDWSTFLNIPAGIADGIDNVDDADADPTNELQNLSSSAAGTNRTINISGGTGTTISVADNDNNPTNEIQDLALVLTQGEDAGGLNAVNMGKVGIGIASPAEALHIDDGNLLQTPGDPVIVGSLAIGAVPRSVYVSGRYAYVVDQNSGDLKVIDVSDPANPVVAGSLVIGSTPFSVYVSGRYAYVVDQNSGDLKVIDVSDPATPVLAGSLAIGADPRSVYISGRYAYVVDGTSDDLKVIDVSDPMNPALAGSLVIGGGPLSVYVSGRYAYALCRASNDLKVIDVSDPMNPTFAGSLGLGLFPASVYVSGRYAYVVDNGTSDLKVIDVSDPANPVLTGSLVIGTAPISVYVSGRYAYVVDQNSRDLKVIDVSDPANPAITGGVGIGSSPRSVYVSGRYAYAVDLGSGELIVIDVSGGELTSLMAHSLEAGNLQVRNDIIAQGQLQVAGGITAGSGGIFSDGDVGVNGQVAAKAFIGDGSGLTNLPISGGYAFSSNLGTSRDEFVGGIGNITGDDNFIDVTLPFSVIYDGVAYTSIEISTNGWLEFGDGLGNPDLSNDPLPTSAHPGPFVAAYWDDLITDTSVSWQTEGTAPNRAFQILSDTQVFGGIDDQIDFTVTIHETSGMIQVRYLTVGAVARGQSATIGFQTAGGGAATAFPIIFNGTVLDDNSDDADPSDQGWSITPLR